MSAFWEIKQQLLCTALGKKPCMKGPVEVEYRLLIFLLGLADPFIEGSYLKRVIQKYRC